MSRLAKRKRWRPENAPRGGAGGFHLPQREGRTSYLTAKAKKTRRKQSQMDVLLLALREIATPRKGGAVKWCSSCGRKHPSRVGCGLTRVTVQAKSGRLVERWVNLSPAAAPEDREAA